MLCGCIRESPLLTFTHNIPVTAEGKPYASRNIKMLGSFINKKTVQGISFKAVNNCCDFGYARLGVSLASFPGHAGWEQCPFQ